MIRTLIFILGLFFGSSAAVAGECDSVLQSGTMSRIALQNNDYARTLYAARLSKMTYKQAKSDTSLTALIPIDGIPLKVGFSQNEFDEFRQSVQSQVDIDQTFSHQDSFVQSVGDKVIVNAWSSCMSKYGGLSVQIAPQGPSNATITIRWWPTPGSEGRSPLIRQVRVAGATIISGQQWTVPQTALGVGTQRIIGVKRASGGAVFATVSTTFGDDAAYLPRIYKAPPTRQASVTIGSCTGHGGVEGLRFWGPPNQPCNGIAGWGPFSELQSNVTRVGSCKGHGGVEGVTLYGPVGSPCGGVSGWGTYEGGLDVSEGFGFCLGQGNVIGSMALWGPKRLPCAGFNGWGVYN